jgi:hypothetical protein
MNAGQEQRLVGVDVSDSSDPSLIEHERLHRSGPSASNPAQALRSELGRERLDPQPQREIRIARRTAEQQVAGPEPPGIDVHQPVPIVEPQPDAGVQRVERRVKQQRSGHPQMDEQMTVV